MEIEPPRRLLVNPATDPLFRSRWSLPRLTGRAGALDQNLRRTWFSLVGEVIRVAGPTPDLILSGRRLGRNSACLLLLMAMSTACSSSDQIEQQSRTAASTAQTVSMTLDAWAAGAAPSKYASGTLQSAGTTLADIDAKIRSATTAEPAEQAALAEAVKDLSIAVNRAQAGVQADRRPQVQEAQEDIRTATRSLAAAYFRYFAPKP
ncbi:MULTISPECIES: hypothetical protein [unclassified Mesorhizobium]|uniref:hypothetical protein n=1 Tax=unclassified Mesorhizobium TaxID=325217 RepID=UPI001CCB5A19|nr:MULTISPECIES: hypothetical protein [unclassified Mesorhizobium]MBZ9702745.1 hypothetical protein [Mesorhizobium sp. CO1-1-3]MBZ9948536.1 hypothetical protein [Mesorhizobium sp. BR1-1-11]